MKLMLSREQIVEKVADLYCPESAGFEGANTFLACGECVVCLCKKEIGADID